MVKKMGREISISLKINSLETKCDVQQIITIIRHMFAKRFLDSSFN